MPSSNHVDGGPLPFRGDVGEWGGQRPLEWGRGHPPWGDIRMEGAESTVPHLASGDLSPSPSEPSAQGLALERAPCDVHMRPHAVWGAGCAPLVPVLQARFSRAGRFGGKATGLHYIRRSAGNVALCQVRVSRSLEQRHFGRGPGPLRLPVSVCVSGGSSGFFSSDSAVNVRPRNVQLASAPAFGSVAPHRTVSSAPLRRTQSTRRDGARVKTAKQVLTHLRRLKSHQVFCHPQGYEISNQ